VVFVSADGALLGDFKAQVWRRLVMFVCSATFENRDEETPLTRMEMASGGMMMRILTMMEGNSEFEIKS